MTSDSRWDPPGPGVWWLTREHFGAPVCRLLFELFPPVTEGWNSGAALYGYPMGSAAWGLVNHWIYYGPGTPADPGTYPALEEAAIETLATSRWRHEVAQWQDVERPATIAANLAFQAVDPAELDDAELAAHFQRAVDHYQAVAPLHFAHSGFDIAGGLLFEATARWGIDHAAVVALLAGASTASRDTARHLALIADALQAAGAGAPATIDDVRAVPGAAAALDAYLHEYGWRVFGNDLTEPMLAELPHVVVGSIRAQLTRDGAAAPEPDIGPVRSQVPATDRDRFDVLLDDARLTYRLRDDDVGITWAWPLGMIRLAVLEIGRRLQGRGTLANGADAFEATTAEIHALLAGHSGPPAAELAERATARVAAANADPPRQLGEPLPPASPVDQVDLPPTVHRLDVARQALWGGAPAPTGRLRGVGVGTGVARGRACVLDGPDWMDDMRPGDVIVATMTTAGHNAVFPLACGVATAEGGLFSHAAILAREFGLPAVLGVAGLLDEVHHGDLVEVDPATGEVRLIERA
jgi:pyruvate,water dikinase